eukprot:CAMPEP_0204834162 /NCGR_PEP_ID=MMETSP1346-20131115/18984_1 /ASSEMBLY_ACC=CAM_ASM_000771 /TAXON_ID=215587 /ORGANISM="Aplanochytrium stocchinoi, Strain GSBS06" /LENGTH=303 /DNA_ID=CAMNT_0051967261 /DNA_START=309 /DNA_END=1220 /DNA_ORIENTATION=-
MEFYAKCMFGGILACGVTHASVVTLDVAKVRTQAHSKAGNWPNGLVASISKTYTGEGVKGLTKGWVPTFWGYGAQGLFKFGLNEFFKDYYSHVIGEENLDQTWKKLVLWALSSGSAEIFADVALCPFEMTKVRMQVDIPEIKMSHTLPESMIPAMSTMYKMRTETKFPFGSLVPLWGRQVPYTMIKFVGFYQTQEMVYEYLESKYDKKKADWSAATQLSITFGCGYWAGIFCAIATQPMDNLVSMKGIAENKNKSWGQMSREMGAVNLVTKGLGTRIIMIGTLTGLQWWIYGTWKNFCGFGTS